MTMRSTIPAEELLSKVRAVGQYYGFLPLSILTAKKRGTARTESDDARLLSDVTLDPTGEMFVSFLKQCRNAALVPTARQPLFIWHSNIAHGRPAPKKATIQFHALGADRALADALIIRALVALVRDVYHAEPSIRINSMGDKETRARYTRELGNFFKKRATLSEEYLTRARQDPLHAAELAIAEECVDDLPAPTEHLSDASRKRLEDLLEYLEMTDTPYELSRTLISRAGMWSDTCFELLIEGQRVAWGSRYTDIARRVLPNISLPAAIGAVVHIASGGGTLKKPSPVRLRFSFIHIGDEAKRLSIRLAEDFKRAHIPLAQNIGVESLTEQLHIAEERNSPYLLIMGRREALEHSAILRNRQTQEETILPLEGIVEHLRMVA